MVTVAFWDSHPKNGSVLFFSLRAVAKVLSLQPPDFAPDEPGAQSSGSSGGNLCEEVEPQVKTRCPTERVPTARGKELLLASICGVVALTISCVHVHKAKLILASRNFKKDRYSCYCSHRNGCPTPNTLIYVEGAREALLLAAGLSAFNKCSRRKAV